jgi:Glyoxalase-like domain
VVSGTTFDHLVVAARTLEEGAAWVESKLGVAPVPGGKHPVMGTHNRLLFIGPGQFLEVMAIDPDAPPPGRPRWFDLDDPAMRTTLARSPALIHWAERTDDLEAAVRGYPEAVEVLSLERGRHRWRIAVPRNGRRPGGGTLPTLLQWDHGPHPSEVLPDPGVRLRSFTHEGGRLRATFETPAGLRAIP